MGDHSNIAWCDKTWNPWIGCTKVSAACDNCYAERDFDIRLKRAKWGHGQPRSKTKTWSKPYTWNRQAAENGVRYKVFCSSLADIFDAEVDPIWLRDAMRIIADCQNLDWLLLTKRPNLAIKWFNDNGWWPPTAWLGATVENEAVAAARIPYLTSAYFAPVRFLSMEPLLGPFDLNEWLTYKTGEAPIDWVIVGGESGPAESIRTMQPKWAYDLLVTCIAHGKPYFLKQMSGSQPIQREAIPKHINVREFPIPRYHNIDSSIQHTV